GAAGVAGLIRLPHNLPGEERAELRMALTTRSLDALTEAVGDSGQPAASGRVEDLNMDEEKLGAALAQVPRGMPGGVKRAGKGETLGMIGKRLKLTKQRVAQIESKALDRLREILGVETK